MTCTSGSVESVADKTVAAKAQIDKLTVLLKDDDEKTRKYFIDAIGVHLRDAKVTDARELSFNSDTKIEYTSEFSLDKIAAVVTSALKAVAAAQDPISPSPAMSEQAIAAYSDVVNTVAEAAKSSSTSAASLAFSMTRLSPGLFSFLYATSVNIKDVDTFGAEAVTATSIYYRFMQSIDDVKNESAFGNALIDAQNLRRMKQLQAGLTEDLAKDTLDIDEWAKKDSAYDLAVKKIQQRLKEASFDVTKPVVLQRAHGFGPAVEHSFTAGSLVTQQIVRASIKALASRGNAYQAAVSASEARLANNYY